MAALPTTTHGGLTYASRGTVGTQGDITTQRLEQEQMLHAIFKDLNFCEPDFFVNVDIPEKMNEVVYWEIDERGSGAVYQINEHGYQTPSVYNSVGVAQSGSGTTDVPGITLTVSSVQATPLRYASIYYYTSVAVSVSKRDPVVRGENEQGRIIAEQLDNLARGAWDTHARDVYPRAAVTTDNLVAATDYFTYAYVIKLEVILRQAGLNPPEGRQRFPMIIPLDAQAGLLLDTTTRSILENTAARGDPMASIFQMKYLGSLRCFDFYASNRLTPTVASLASVGRAYIVTREAMAMLAMQSDSYGQRPKQDANSGNEAGMRAWKEETPRPVKVWRHDPGSGALGADPFMNRGAVAEVHTLGIHALRAGFLIRAMFAVSTAADWGAGAGRAGTAGAVIHTAA